MLFPQENSTRALLNLSGFWKFTTDIENNGETKGYSNRIPDDREIAVPASWNEQHQDLMNFCQTGWYEREVEIPRYFEGNCVYLRVGAANYLAKVWLNGTYIGEHEGPHLPFEFDVTRQIRFGMKNKLVIAVDARIQPDRLPPGGVENEQIVGFKGQFPNNYYDFHPYGGINRPVYFSVVPPIHITAINVNTGYHGHIGMIHYRIKLNQSFNGRLQIFLDDQTKTEVDLNDTSEITGILEVPGVKLWSPQRPYLYQMKVALIEDERLMDGYEQSVGIRTVKIEGTTLLLNDEPVFLKGFGMHEDFPILGKGMNQAVIIKDFNLLKWIGANSLRTSHYPYSEEFLNYADREGILVIGETPFVGFVRSHYRDDAVLAKAKRVITEMISRDLNHPSIIAWSLANEGDTFVAEADSFYKNLYDHAKSLDISRPMTITNCMDIAGDVALKHFDFISINRYYGWYEQAGQLDLGCEKLDEKLDECFQVFGKPVLVTEFGADAVAGIHFDPPQQFSEEYQAEMVIRQYQIIQSKPYTIGAHIWAFADFKTSQTPSRVIMNRKGLFTRERQPKLAAHRIKELW